MKYSIVIPTYNHCDDLLVPCVNSVFNNSNFNSPDIELIIVANGCTDNTKSQIASWKRKYQSKVKSIWSDEPLGFTKAANLGLKKATGDYIVLLNNDTEILNFWPKNLWLETLEKPFIKDKKTAATGIKKLFDDVTGRPFLIFFCVMFDKKLLKELNYLDEIFSPGFGEDIDFSFKAEDAGYKIIQVPEDNVFDRELPYPIMHLAEGTMHSDQTEWDKISAEGSWQKIIVRNKKILRDRYVKKLETIKETKSHKITNYIEEIKKENLQLFETVIEANEYGVLPEHIKGKNILDIGANIGTFTALCLTYNPEKIIALEPVNPFFKKLETLFEGNEKVNSIRRAISTESHKKVFLTNETLGSHIANEGMFSALTISLEHLLSYFPEDDNDIVIKFDCEGTEHDVLLNSKIEILRRFKTIFIEIHEMGNFNKNKHSSKKLISFLEKRGFIIGNKIDYWGWEYNENGDRINEGKMPVVVCRFDRIEKFEFIPEEKIKYSIIIPTYNHCDDLLKPCIESLIKNTFLNDKEFFIVANGCTDNTKDYVESLPNNFKLLWFDEAIGYTKATNEGIKESSGEYIILLNNDVVFIDSEKDRWIDLLRAPFERNEKTGMSGPMKFHGEPGISNDFIMFFCAMTTKKIIDEIGLLDEQFSPGGVEDIDYGIRMIDAGYELVEVPLEQPEKSMKESITIGEFPIFHKGGSTVSEVKNWNKILLRNNDLLKKKFKDKFFGIDWINEKRDFKIFDCFPFFNEIELLEIRLEELYEIVDYFVIVEASQTHSGKRKIYNFEKNKEKFERFKDKIIYHKFAFEKDHGESDDPWVRERIQRDEILKVLEGKCEDNDYVIISDVDEIPRKEAINSFISVENDNVGILKQDRFIYFLNNKVINETEEQLNSRIAKFKIVKEISPCGVRYCDLYNLKPNVEIENGGWHFTFMGGAKKVKEKISAFAHQEYNNSENTITEIKQKINDGINIYSSSAEFKFVAIDSSFPKSIIKNKRKLIENEWILDASSPIEMDEDFPWSNLPEGWFNDENISTYRKLVSSIPDNSKIAELGTWCGRSLCSIADIVKRKNLTVFAVDTFTGTDSTEFEQQVHARAKTDDLKKELETNLELFKIRDNVVIFKMRTDEAVKYFENKSLDLVFIDADHVYSAVKNDIELWYPKVKAGGILVGHDYTFDEVTKAVNETIVETINSEGNAEWEVCWWITKKTVYDCFPFFNEFELLSLRLHELEDVVDYFVLCESDKTHAGKPKELYFERDKSLFNKFNIIHLIDKELPDGKEYGDNWSREFHQRDYLFSISDRFRNDDVIIMGDVDEIPNKNIIINYRNDKIYRVGQQMCYYYMNFGSDEIWSELKISAYKFIKNMSATELRRLYDNIEILENGGFHFSYLGGIERIKTKLESYAHQEYNKDNFKSDEYIKEMILNGDDLFGRTKNVYHKINIDNNFPNYALMNLNLLKKAGLIL